MKKKQLYGRGVPMLCIACQLTVAPLFFSSRVQAVPVAPTFLTTAQTQEMRTIKGIVRDVNNQPLPGATIRIKGTSTGVVSDVDGNYTIAVPDDPNTTLLVSFVGMKTQEQKIGKSTALNFILEEDATVLDQVVVNGVFERKANTFTGSVRTIGKDDLKRVGNSNVLQSLKNLDPSIMFFDNMSLGSDPNAMPEMVLRGKSSINMEDVDLKATYQNDPNAPLFVLDGFETSLQKIMDLDMDRVESLTILKDASAKAIYGSKAANGVVVVETKLPAMGSLRVNYNGNLQLTFADLSDYNLMNASEKLEFERLSGHYGKLDENGEILHDKNRALYYKRLARVIAGLNTYWMDKPLRTAWTHEHSLNIEGGDAAFRYGLTFRYKNNQGVMKKSERQNVDGTINLLYRVEKFNLSNQTTIGYTNAPNSTVPFSSFSRMNPYESPYDENGEILKVLEEKSVYNPLWDFIQKSYDESDALDFRNNLILEYRPINGMRVQGKFASTFSSSGNGSISCLCSGFCSSGRTVCATMGFRNFIYIRPNPQTTDKTTST